jgi:hypothetical protein
MNELSIIAGGFWDKIFKSRFPNAKERVDCLFDSNVRDYLPDVEADYKERSR